MFSFTGLNAKQVESMIKKHSIYMTADGRISVCGITTKNVNYIASAMKDVVENIKWKLFLISYYLFKYTKMVDEKEKKVNIYRRVFRSVRKKIDWNERPLGFQIRIQFIIMLTIFFLI